MKANSVSRLAKAVVVAVLVLFVSNASFANEGHPSKKAGLTESQVNVQYIGIKDESLVFKLEFENPTSDKFWLIIKNDAGDVVYHKQFNDAHFTKTVFLQNDNTDIHPTFVIRDSNNNEVVRQFSVSTTVVESTVVTKL